MKKKLKTIRGVDITGKRVIFRVDYNFTLERRGQSYRLPDDYRIQETIPTLRYLIRKRAKVVILTWLGRPKRKEKRFMLDPVAKRLTTLLKQPVKKLGDSVGLKVERHIKQMEPGEVVLLENVRFHSEDTKCDLRFARRLARLGDLVVNDAFAQVHRQAASLAPLQKLLPSYAGFLICKELDELEALFKNPKRPRVAVIGGVKVSTRMVLIERLCKDFEYVLLGGALANTILKARGEQVGRSLIEQEMVHILESKEFLLNNIVIPVDVMVANAGTKARVRRRPVGRVNKYESIFDIGPDTCELYDRYIKEAGTVVWNGPMGLFEIPPYNKGTQAIARSIARSKARSIIGGGDTIAAIRQAKLEKKFDFVSTGGGAMLHHLEGSSLPGLKYIKRKR